MTRYVRETVSGWEPYLAEHPEIKEAGFWMDEWMMMY